MRERRVNPLRSTGLGIVALSTIPACASAPAKAPPHVPAVIVDVSAPVATPMVEAVEARAVGVEAPWAEAPPLSATPGVAHRWCSHADLAPDLVVKLSSGLTFDLVVEIELRPPSGRPSRVPIGGCAVSFDLWDELYRVRMPPVPPAATARVAAATTLGAVVSQCTDEPAYIAARSAAPTSYATRCIVRRK